MAYLWEQDTMAQDSSLVIVGQEGYISNDAYYTVVY